MSSDALCTVLFRAPLSHNAIIWNDIVCVYMFTDANVKKSKPGMDQISAIDATVKL
jgi:hypothetical protein